MLIPQSIFDIFGGAGQLISYGVSGSALWFLIPWLTDRALVAVFPVAGRAKRAVTVIAVIPAVRICFAILDDFGVFPESVRAFDHLFIPPQSRQSP